MNGEALDVFVWREIINAMTEVQAEIERALQGDATDLSGLYRKACYRLDALRVALEGRVPGAEALAVLTPLCFLLDERVIARLNNGTLRRRLSWPLLQKALVGAPFGGDLFYIRLDALLASVDAPELLLQVYLYCLSEGFVGRYADAPAQVEVYRVRLWERLKTPAWPDAPVVPANPTPGVSALWLCVAIALAQLAMWQGLWWGLRANS